MPEKNIKKTIANLKTFEFGMYVEKITNELPEDKKEFVLKIRKLVYADKISALSTDLIAHYIIQKKKMTKSFMRHLGKITQESVYDQQILLDCIPDEYFFDNSRNELSVWF